MADTVSLGNFDLGFQSDLSRDQLPRGVVFRMRDWIPQLGSPLRKRGGYGFASLDLNSLSAATRLAGVGWAPFAGDPHLLALSETGKVYQVKAYGGTGGTYLGTTHGQAVTHRPFWHRDRMIVLPALEQAAASPYKVYTSSPGVYAIAVLGGSPPQARVGFSWGDYLVLLNGYVTGTLYNYRMWFSGVGNPESWVLTGSSASYFDVDDEAVAGMALRNVILIWGYDRTWMIQGDTPPPGGNLSKKTFLRYGTMDGRSVVNYREYALWANNSGVYRTDGATLTDLTKAGGISAYWRSLVKNFNFKTGWSASAGVLYGHYIVTILDTTGALVTTLACDIDRGVWFEFTNIKAAMYAERVSGPGTATEDGHEELFFAHRTTPRVGTMSGLWEPVAGNASDADGTAVLPRLETGFYNLGGDALKRLRWLFVSYDLRTTGASPILRVSQVLSPEDTTYDAMTPTLAATSKLERKPVNIRRKALGIAFLITQENVSSDTRLYDLEIAGHELEGTR